MQLARKQIARRLQWRQDGSATTINIHMYIISRRYKALASILRHTLPRYDVTS